MKYSIDMTLRDLLSDNRCIEILDRFLPGIRDKMQSNPMAGTFSLRQVSGFTNGLIPESALLSIEEELVKLNDGTLTPREKEKVCKYREMLIKDRENQKLPKPETGNYTAFHPGQPWLDTAGKRIQAHGGAVFYEDGWYYWYGENKEHTDGDSDIWSWGIRCYRSRDLYNWQDLGMIIEPDVENPDSNLFPDKHVDRPHIVKSAVTGKYVCWIKLSGISSCYTVMVSDHLLGPYGIVKEDYRPFGYEVGDFDLYTEEQTGKAYLFETGNHDGVFGMELSGDCCSAQKEISLQYDGLKPPFTREGIAVFERGNKKYMITSGMTGYLPNRSDLAVADRWDMPFASVGDPHVNDDSHASFNSQISKVFRVEGTDCYIAMADRWVPDMLLDARLTDMIERMVGSSSEPDRFSVTKEEREEVLRIPAMDDTRANTSVADYVWLPVRFEGGKAYIDWKETWKVER